MRYAIEGLAINEYYGDRFVKMATQDFDVQQKILFATTIAYLLKKQTKQQQKTRYECSASELQPPTTVDNFNDPYPLGFEGNQLCPITDGIEFIKKNYDMYDEHWVKWVLWVAVVCFWFFYTGASYIALR